MGGWAQAGRRTERAGQGRQLDTQPTDQKLGRALSHLLNEFEGGEQAVTYASWLWCCVMEWVWGQEGRGRTPPASFRPITIGYSNRQGL